MLKHILVIKAKITFKIWNFYFSQVLTGIVDNMYNILGESAKLCTLRALAPTRLTHHWYAPYAPYPSLIRACAPLHLMRLRVFTYQYAPYAAFFALCCCFNCKVTLRLKNPRKATGPDFIPLKFIKFALNLIDSHLYNVVIKDPEKTST